MQVSMEDVYSIANDVWEVMFKSHLDYGYPDMPCDPDRILTGYVTFSGSEYGTVVLEISGGLARQAASNMLSMEAAQIGDADMQDAVRELTNIIGSHVKSLLAESCKLSIPKIGTDLNALLASGNNQIMLQATFRSGDLPLRITILVPARIQ